MAKKPNVLDDYFKNSLLGRGLSYLQDQQRPPTTTGSNIFSRSVNSFMSGVQAKTGLNVTGPYTGSMTPLSQRDTTSEGLADVRASGARPFAGSGITVDRSPVEDAPGYTSSITSTGNFVIRDASGKVIFSNNQYSSAADADAFVAAKEAAKEEEVKPTAVEEKTDEITDLATKITTKRSGVSAGPAQDAAEEFKEKGRKSTILTSAQGITDEPVTGMLSEGEAEAERKRKLREKRSLLAG